MHVYQQMHVISTTHVITVIPVIHVFALSPYPRFPLFHDASWLLMIHHEYSWRIMRTHDASWVLLIHYESSCHEYPRWSMSIPGESWVLMISQIAPKIVLDDNGLRLKGSWMEPTMILDDPRLRLDWSLMIKNCPEDNHWCSPRVAKGSLMMSDCHNNSPWRSRIASKIILVDLRLVLSALCPICPNAQ